MWKGKCRRCGHVNKWWVDKCGDADAYQSSKYGKGCKTGMARGVFSKAS